MLFDGDGLTYRDLKSMDMAEYYECIAAKKMFVQQLKEQQQKEYEGCYGRQPQPILRGAV